LGADKIANTSPELSLTITPILIFLNDLSTIASQLTLIKPIIGAFQQRTLWKSTPSPLYHHSWALQKAACDSKAFSTIKVGG
jgi:hypothetical protein